MILKQCSITSYITTCLSLPAIMSPSAPPKRGSADTSRPRQQKHAKKPSSSSSALAKRSAAPPAKKRRLNDGHDASGSSAAAQMPQATRSGNTRARAGSDSSTKRQAVVNHAPKPAVATTSAAPESRSLRSQDAAKPKSDLAKYFPDFDDIISGETAEDDGAFPLLPSLGQP